MPIKLINSHQPGSTPAKIVLDIINIGKQYISVSEQSQFYRRLRVNSKIAETIRSSNEMLGMSGNFKNGCLYREKGLPEFWKKGDERVICDHAIPVTELVSQYSKGQAIEELIFSPVVRISKKSNDILTQNGFAKKGHEKGFPKYPLYRYTHIGMKILTHLGDEIDPGEWTEKDHWNLIMQTKELMPVVAALELNNLEPK